MRIRLLFVTLFAVLVVAGSVAAQPLNVGTLRGTVVSTEPDCLFCSLSTPHGCYIVISAPDVLNIALPAGSSACAAAVGDCLEATGQIANDAVSAGFSVSSIQLVATIGAVLPTETCSGAYFVIGSGGTGGDTTSGR